MTVGFGMLKCVGATLLLVLETEVLYVDGLLLGDTALY